MKESENSIWQKLNTWEVKRLGILMILFFMAMSVFSALKPLRKSLFIGYFKDNPLHILETTLGGAQAEQLAKLSVVIVAVFVAIGFTRLIRIYSMRKVLLMVCAVAISGLIASCFFIGDPGAVFVWSFYIFGDFINSLIITILWLLLHNTLTTKEAKGIYSVIGIGTVAGGMFGALFVYQSVSVLGREAIVALSAIPIFVVGMLAYFMACRITDSRGKMKNCMVVYEDNRFDKEKNESTMEMLKKDTVSTGSKRYWLGIALLVGIYEISSGIIDFQLSVAVENVQATAYERDMYFGIIGQVQNFLALLLQVFVTGWVLKRWGVGVALLILPFATVFGSVGFLLLPTLASAMFLSVSDNALNYSVTQSAKETLYVPTNSEERVAAKTLIDIFVQRFAKAFAVILNLFLVALIGLQNIRWLSVLAIALMIGWIIVARFTSRKFESFVIEEPSHV